MTTKVALGDTEGVPSALTVATDPAEKSRISAFISPVSIMTRQLLIHSLVNRS